MKTASLLTITSSLCLIAPLAHAQNADPFSAGNDPFASSANPFAESSPAPEPMADPFGAPPANDPFAGGPPAADPFASGGNSPFGGGPAADPFASGGNDPFGGPAGTADPFASNGNDPFGGPGGASDPFAGGGNDPFGGSNDPFAAGPGGGPVGGGPVADPFGGAPSGEYSSPVTDPFGGGATNAPAGGGAVFGDADPFSDPNAFGASDPFSSTPGGFDPTAAPAPSGEVNESGIAEVFDFRFERARLWNGQLIVNRKQLTREEAEQFDTARIAFYQGLINEGRLSNFTGGSDPATWAEWSYFAEQTFLWSEYVENVALAGLARNDSESQTAYEIIGWAAANETGEGENGEQANGDDEFNVFSEADNSLDDQLGGLLFDTGGNNAAPTQDPSALRTALENRIVAAYKTKLDQLRAVEEAQESFMEGFENRIIERTTRRLAYNDWRADQQQQVIDFVEDWNRRYNGDVAMIGGIRYELYRPGQVPTRIRQDARVVVTDYQLTPYDILDPDTGQLKSSSD